MIVDFGNGFINPEGVSWYLCESCHPFGIFFKINIKYKNPSIPSGFIITITYKETK